MAKPKHKILIVDDTLEDREIYRKYLCADDECEYLFDEAELAKDGLTKILSCSYDCVLLDFQLPDIDGIAFLGELQKKVGNDHAPVVMITGRGDERVAVQALKLGAADYLVKSDLTPESIYRATRNSIEKRQRELELARETESARTSQEHFLSLVEGARDYAMIILDKNGLISQWNHGAQELTGYSHEEAIGKHVEILFDDKDRQKGIPSAELERAHQAGRFEIERWLRRKDGQRFWASGSVSLLYNSNGGVRGFAKIIRDGTQRKYFDEERSNDSKWFESLLDFLPIPILLIEPKTGRMQFANKSAHAAAGGHFPLVDSIDDYKKVYKFADPKGGPLSMEDFPSVRASRGEKVLSQEVSWESPKGRQILLVDAVLMAPLFGRNAVVAMTFQNISAIKSIQEDLERARMQAENANVAKSHFLANMSHEIRTPLGAILGFTDLLVRPGTSDSDRTKFASTIKRNGNALMQIIDDILDLSKIEAGKLEIESVSTEFRKVIADVIDLFSVRLHDCKLTLHLRIEERIPKSIESDPTRLRQILFNVIGNAIKFTNSGTITVKVALLDKENGISFSVTDTGIGITSDQRARLFQPFSQADNSTTRKFGGTGLGLMLSKRLAEAMGGEFFLSESVLGQGSTFELRLPYRPIHENESDRPSKSPRDCNVSGTKILLIEDVEDGRVLFERILQNHGVDVTVAQDGRKAVEIVKQDDFDLVITDVQMPHMDGYETAKHLREIGFKKPILALTAHAFKEDSEKSKRAGLDDHLTKPIDEKTLLARLAFHLHRSGGIHA